MPKAKKKITIPFILSEVTQELHAVLGQIADNVMITDIDGIIEYVNPAFEKTTGYSKKEVLGKTPAILKSGQQPDDYYKKLWTTILKGESFRATVINKNKKGEIYYADQTISSIKDKDDKIIHFVSVWKDITVQIRTQKSLEGLAEKLELEKGKLEAVLGIEEGLNSIVNLDKLVDFIVDKTIKILEAQKCSVMFYNENSGELRIKGCKGLEESVVRECDLKIGDPIAGLIAEDKDPVLVVDIETDRRFERKKRNSYETKSFLSAPIILGQNLFGIINVADKNSPESNVFNSVDLKILCMIVRNVAVAIENAKLFKELKFLTVTDPLTHIYNYRHFAKSLDHEIKRVNRFERPLSILMIDIDNFKAYNDSFGHLEGDKLLKDIGTALTSTLREVDIACRYAGDEFVVILPETDIENAKIVAKKILAVTEGLSEQAKVTVSIGIASCVKGMSRYDAILKADTALYEAKKNGKNQFFLNENDD